MARVDLGRPRRLPFLLHTGGQHSASLDQGSAVDGTSPLFALGPHRVGWGSWALAFPCQALLATPAQLSYVVLRRPSSGSFGVEVGSHTVTGGSLAYPIALTLSRLVARVRLGRPRGLLLLLYIPEAGTLRPLTRARP